MFRWFVRQPLHLRIAILVAPILAIGGYGMADLWSRPKEAPAEIPVAMYTLNVDGTCSLSTGPCKLTYETLTAELVAAPASSPELLRFNIKSSQLIRGVKMALVQQGVEEHLVAQESVAGEWFVEFPKTVIKNNDFSIRIAMAQTKKLLMAEFAAKL